MLDWMDYMHARGYRLTNRNFLEHAGQAQGVKCLDRPSERTPGQSEFNAFWKRMPKDF